MKRHLANAVVVIYLGWFLVTVATRYYYTWHRPTFPSLTAGFTVPVSLNYGRVVYVTPHEERLLSLAPWLFFPLFTICIVVYRWYQRDELAKPTVGNGAA
jgi:hypothetical protein